MNSPDVDAFLRRLEETALLEPRRMEKTRTRADGISDPAVIAAQLVERGYLTRWQARMILSGKDGPFFFDHYRILKPLGQGGMAVVYKALQPAINRTVALKVLSRRALRDERTVIRFQREIRAAAALDHPHIIHAYDAGCVKNTYFLVMEYVKGRDLKQWITSAGPLPVNWCCECIRQAALGLQYAHERGIVHRDIKPSNLLLVQKSLREPPHVKIADFGLARAGLDVVDEQGLTRVGQGLGTSEYVAPEQASDSTRADIRSDIFSLGCTMFEMLTGKLPFDGGSSFERLMARFKQDAPPVSSLRAGIPPALDQVVARMMSRDAGRRFQTPTDVTQALVPFCDFGQAPPAGVGNGRADEPQDTSAPDGIDSDSALDQFRESLSGDFSSRSLASLPRGTKQRKLLAGVPVAIATVAVLALIFIVSWTLSGRG